VKEKTKAARRPKSLYVFTTWTLLRGILPLFTNVGLYRIYVFRNQSASDEIISNNSFLSNFFHIWLKYFTVPDKLFTIVSFLMAIIITTLAVATYRGLKWGAKGLIWASMFVLIWNMRVFLLGLPINLPLYSLAALCLTSWYFRQLEILKYFDEREISPGWADKKFGKFSLEIVLAFLLIGFGIAFESIGFIRQMSLF
jgi:hypothetical protein